LPTRLQIDAEQCRRSYYEFLKRAWHVLEPETDFINNWHIEYLCNILQKEAERIGNKKPKTKDLIINIPPRSLKSSIVTVFWNAWVWISYPHIKFITASYSGDLSIEHALKTRRLIESDWYKSRFGSFTLTGDQNVKSKFDNDKGGSRRATSIGGTVTGVGADIIIGDDPSKAQEIYSSTSRKTVIDWWAKTMFSRLNNQKVGLRLVVMQRLHEEDLTGVLLDTKANYEHICLPAKLSKDLRPANLKSKYKKGLFFPEIFDEKFLEDAKISLGTRDYAGQYEQKPSPAEGDMIKGSWFGSFTRDELPEGLSIDFYSDTAYGKEGSDNSATIAYTYYDNKFYIWGCVAWNLKFPEFIQSYKTYLVSMGADRSSRCIFEPKASGVSILQHLESETGLNIIEDKPPVESKMSRVASVSPILESGRVLLYNKGNGLDDLVDECKIFPNGANDDRVDALTGLILYNAGKVNMYMDIL